MDAGGFTFAFVRPIAKLFTNESNTTPTHVAGARSSFAAICSVDGVAAPAVDGGAASWSNRWQKRSCGCAAATICPRL